MFDAVETAVERRRPAITDSRLKRCERTKVRDEFLGLNGKDRCGVLDRKRILLDRSGKETHRHRAVINFAAVARKERTFRIAIRRKFLERAMVGGFGRRGHRPAISDARRSGTVQTDKHRDEESKKSNFQRVPYHKVYYASSAT